MRSVIFQELKKYLRKLRTCIQTVCRICYEIKAIDITSLLICILWIWHGYYTNKESKYIHYFKLVFLKIQNVTNWSFFQNQVTLPINSTLVAGERRVERLEALNWGEKPLHKYFWGYPLVCQLDQTSGPVLCLICRPVHIIISILQTTFNQLTNSKMLTDIMHELACISGKVSSTSKHKMKSPVEVRPWVAREPWWFVLNLREPQFRTVSASYLTILHVLGMPLPLLMALYI